MTKKQRDTYRYKKGNLGQLARLKYIYETRVKPTYGISFDAYIAFTKIKRCDICGKEKTTDNPLHIDHCHKTRIHRGALCHSCNVGLGHFKDNIEIMKTAIDYLQCYEEVQQDPEVLQILIEQVTHNVK